MQERKKITQESSQERRALFKSDGLDIYDTIFDDGESPLKREQKYIADRMFFQMEISTVVL